MKIADFHFTRHKRLRVLYNSPSRYCDIGSWAFSYWPSMPVSFGVRIMGLNVMIVDERKMNNENSN